MTTTENSDALSKLPKTKKAWGHEYLITNELGSYCGKFLCISPGKMSSMHYHPIKKETFYIVDGIVWMRFNDEEWIKFGEGGRATIAPGESHQFGIPPFLAPAIILEISTYHDDKDVVRLSESGDWKDD